jgi:hypothetical protein
VAQTATRGKARPAVPVLQQQSKEQEKETLLQKKALSAGAHVNRFAVTATAIPPLVNSMPAAVAQKKEAGDKPSGEVRTRFTPLQKTTNNTSLPDNLKPGAEQMSGYNISDVQVHYNSPKPMQLQAAQGTDIHIGPGQERHLPHETWHVIQQKQGRVKTTIQMKGTSVNDDPALENEASQMGNKAL